MKIFSTLLISLFCFTNSFISQKYSNSSFNNEDCQSIVDSANIYNLTSEEAINVIPTIKDNERKLRLDKWLQQLSFQSLTCLLESKNVSLKVLGFMYAALNHSDSLYKKYSYLLKDTTGVQFFTANGTSGPKIKLGELLSQLTQGIKEDNKNLAKEPEIKKMVSAFIKKYATFPKTYKPISFPYFSMGSDNEGLTGFNVRHEYEIKNNEAKMVRVVSAFAIDKNLRITVIEKDSTSYGSAYPPKLDYWFKEFGRKLNKKDSTALMLNMFD